jgi:hypothetical protein
MKSDTLWRLRSLTVPLMLCVLATAGSPASAADASAGAAALERLKSLAGRWNGGEGDNAYAMEFDVVAGGHSVVAREFPDTDHEMTTVYYLRDGELVGQHYCMLGNQPRYRHRPGGDPAEIRFDFAGGDNLDPARDQHAHDGYFRFHADGTLESTWSFWRDGKTTNAETFRLRRAP